MILFVHQPEFMPWLGFFDRLARCGTYVVYDDVQFEHGGFQNRNRIRTPKGWQWLTVPIKHNHPQNIKNVKIANQKWISNHLELIKSNYRKTPFFNQYYPQLKEIMQKKHELLIDLNLDLIKLFMKILGINAEIEFSSEFSNLGIEKNEKLISMCRYVGADIYLSGSGAKVYLEESTFTECNIRVLWHDYIHPVYRQVFPDFQPYMSIIDLIFNLGPLSKETILKGSKTSQAVPLTESMVNI